MLQAAAQRGVRINVIVYKEVTQALTRTYTHSVTVDPTFGIQFQIEPSALTLV